MCPSCQDPLAFAVPYPSDSRTGGLPWVALGPLPIRNQPYVRKNRTQAFSTSERSGHHCALGVLQRPEVAQFVGVESASEVNTYIFLDKYVDAGLSRAAARHVAFALFAVYVRHVSHCRPLPCFFAPHSLKDWTTTAYRYPVAFVHRKSPSYRVNNCNGNCMCLMRVQTPPGGAAGGIRVGVWVGFWLGW